MLNFRRCLSYRTSSSHFYNLAEESEEIVFEQPGSMQNLRRRHTRFDCVRKEKEDQKGRKKMGTMFSSMTS
ncbi:hypothetical protein DPMN_012636 [Dreissena polymorpha]|uniref:Uncharacterized protein n=1 Tax=Dreissena polymorpha TaxID=45954 RepID=A0A9D4S303_DREPO|nr:hypothetical protein DPMN_012636 [Dreissena polymorpha]